MDTSKLPEARIERERYVLAVFEHETRTYFNTSSEVFLPAWVGDSRQATRYSTQQEALQAIEAYGQKFHANSYTRPWEIWLVAESKPVTADWRVDSERQII